VISEVVDSLSEKMAVVDEHVGPKMGLDATLDYASGVLPVR